VREDRFRSCTYCLRTKSGTAVITNVKQTHIPFAPISKGWSSEELKELTRAQFIPFRITQARGNTVWVHPDCFTDLLESMERKLMEEFDSPQKGTSSPIAIIVGQPYMVRSQATGKVYRGIAMEAETGSKEVERVDVNMLLVDYARVEAITGSYVKHLPNQYRSLISCAFVAKLVVADDGNNLQEYSPAGGSRTEGDCFLGQILAQRKTSESYRRRESTQVTLLVKDFTRVNTAGPMSRDARPKD